MGKTLLFINGSDTKKLNDNVEDMDYHMFNSKYFSNVYNNIVHIGDKIKGISLNELIEQLSDIDKDAKSIDVIINMHGTVKDRAYYLELEHNSLISGEKFLKVFAKNLSKPTKILFGSCYGANIHKYASALNSGSILISFSDFDKSTYEFNFCNKYMPQYMDLFSREKLPIEYLALIYCLSQLRAPSSPIISKVDNSGNSITWEFDKYFIKDSAPKIHAPSEYLKNLLSINQFLKPEYLIEVGTNITNEKYWIQIREKGHLVEPFVYSKINFAEYFKQYYFNYERLLIQVNSKENTPQRIKVSTNDKGEPIIEVPGSKSDFTFKNEKNQIADLKNKINEYEKISNVKLPKGLELEKSIKVFADLSEVKQHHDSEKKIFGIVEKTSSIDAGIMKYFAACYFKGYMIALQCQLKKIKDVANNATILEFLEMPPPIKFINSKEQPFYINLHDPINDLISKFSLAQTMAGDQIMQELSGETNTQSDIV